LLGPTPPLLWKKWWEAVAEGRKTQESASQGFLGIAENSGIRKLDYFPARSYGLTGKSLPEGRVTPTGLGSGAPRCSLAPPAVT